MTDKSATRVDLALSLDLCMASERLCLSLRVAHGHRLLHTVWVYVSPRWQSAWASGRECEALAFVFREVVGDWFVTGHVMPLGLRITCVCMSCACVCMNAMYLSWNLIQRVIKANAIGARQTQFVHVAPAFLSRLRDSEWCLYPTCIIRYCFTETGTPYTARGGPTGSSAASHLNSLFCHRIVQN